MKKRMTLSAPPRPVDFAPVAAVAVIGLGLALVVFLLIERALESAEQQRFQRDAAQLSALFTASVDRHVNALASLRAFVSASRSVSRWEFSTFAKEALPGNPGFTAFFWVPTIPDKERARYEAGLQRDGLYGLTVRELDNAGRLKAAAERPVYRPISYVEPFEGSRVAVGLDLSGLPDFAPLFEKADKTGQVAVSWPLTRSVLDSDLGPQVIVAFPFLAEVKGKPKGYALGVLKFERILTALRDRGAAPVEIAIAYNEPAFAKKLIYSSVGDPAASRNISEWTRPSDFSLVTPFTVAGQQFVLGLRAPPAAFSFWSIAEPAGAALLIAALSALLAQHLYVSIAAKHAVERAVVLRTIQLQRANTTLEEEIRQRREVETELRAAKDKAEGASRAKSEFLSTMSHELRTPLNAIIGFSSMLASPGMASPQNFDEYVRHIHDSGIRLLGLINDLLDLSQMDSGRMQLDEERVYIPEIVGTVMEKAKAKAEAAGVTLSATVPDTLPALRADERRLQKALANIVFNAIKFTPRGGHAEITASETADGAISLSVTDTGVGIAKGQEKAILEPFVQLESALSRNHDGAGLGLAFAKRVADLHQTELSITSEVGKGTCVTLRFPARRVIKSAEVA